MKIAINLLPTEFKEEHIKNSRFYKIQTIGVSCILVIFFMASLTIALRILQSQNITNIQKSVSASEQKISNLKDIQNSIFVLKDRISTITQYLNNPSQQSQVYRLISKAFPTSVTLNSISIDRNLDVLISATSQDARSIDTLINNLTDQQMNEGRVSQVSIENLNRGRDNLYRLSLKIKLNPI